MCLFPSLNSASVKYLVSPWLAQKTTFNWMWMFSYNQRRLRAQRPQQSFRASALCQEVFCSWLHASLDSSAVRWKVSWVILVNFSLCLRCLLNVWPCTCVRRCENVYMYVPLERISLFLMTWLRSQDGSILGSVHCMIYFYSCRMSSSMRSLFLWQPYCKSLPHGLAQSW